jgi:hypothetical protein
MPMQNPKLDSTFITVPSCNSRDCIKSVEKKYFLFRKLFFCSTQNSAEHQIAVSTTVTTFGYCYTSVACKNVIWINFYLQLYRLHLHD